MIAPTGNQTPDHGGDRFGLRQDRGVEAGGTELANGACGAIVPWHDISAMKNFHLPLPDETYQLLRGAAERAQVPATTLAREAIDLWLREERRKARHAAIAAYALEAAGTPLDLDVDLEAAGVEHLLHGGKRKK